MEVSQRITYLVLTGLVILNVADASQMSMGMMSRNALSQSVRRVYFGNRSSSLASKGYSSLDSNEYENGFEECDDIFQTSSSNNEKKSVQLCSVSVIAVMYTHMEIQICFVPLARCILQ